MSDRRRVFCSRLLVVATAAALALGAEPTAHGQTAQDEVLRSRAESDVVRYHAMLEAYRAGDDAHGVSALLSISARRARTAVNGSDGPKDPFHPWPATAYQLAVLLHTDAALTLVANASTSDPFIQFELATDLIQRGMERRPDEMRTFVDDWCVAVVRQLRDGNAAPLAERLLGSWQRRFRNNPVVLREGGTLAESFATRFAFELAEVGRSWVSGRAVVLEPILRRRRDNLNVASQRLGEALRLAPHDEEVALHFGRVLALKLSDDDALLTLQRLFTTTRDASRAYMAALFTAAIHDRRGRVSDAEQWYRAAMAKHTTGQAAPMGLADTLSRSGRTSEARDVIQRLLATRVDEPLWWYDFEPPGVADARLNTLRAGARQ